MVHPDFQRRGFGVQLTEHCNAIADQYKARTWVGANAQSGPMFRRLGFKDIEITVGERSKGGKLYRDPQL